MHLELDHIYSVGLSNIKIKRSFGTALKLANFNNKLITLITIIAIIGLICFSPPVEGVIKLMGNSTMFEFYSLNLQF